MDKGNKHLKERMMQPDPSPPISPHLFDEPLEDDVTSDPGLSFPVTNHRSLGEEASPLYRPSSKADGGYVSVSNPGAPLFQQHESGSSETWIRILGVLTVALFIDVFILSIYLYDGPYVGPPRAHEHESIFVEASDDCWKQLPDQDTILSSLAFGSCSSQDRPQTYWDTLSTMDPDVLILAGDNVYGDCADANCSALQTAYEDWASHPSFAGAKKTFSVVATLDDNDYGLHDADMNNPYKDVAKQLFLDFFHIMDERRDRTTDGVYKSYEWGPEGKRVQLILLDTRYSRSPFLPTDMYGVPLKERYRPDYTGTDKQMLSEDQWTWLQAQLVRPTNVRLIVSSIQVLAEGTGFECWRMLPHERNRLLAALNDNLPGTATVILSGDRLVGGFYQNDGLLEVTSSSWTHTLPYGNSNNCWDAKACDEVDPRRIGDFVRVNNFGSIELDWEKRIMTLALRHVDPSFHNSTHYSSDEGTVIQSYDYPIP